MPQTFFLTGITSGLGHALALTILSQGHHLIGTVRNRHATPQSTTIASLESQGATILELDVTDAQACERVWKEAELVHGGGVDVLVNCAGMAWVGAMEDYSDAEVHAQMDVNVYGPFRLIRAALPGFRARKSGTIVNISSVSGIDGVVASGLYAMSKFALEGLTEALAAELSPHNITVLLIEPGAFRTNFLGACKSNSLAHLSLYPSAERTLNIFSSFSGKQRGDPMKAARRIVEVVTGTGMAGELRGKVLRVPLGPDCVGRFEGKVEGLRRDLEAARAVAMSTDVVD